MFKRCIKNFIYEWFLFVILLALYIPGRDQDWFIGVNRLAKLALLIKGVIVIPTSFILTALTRKKYLRTNQLEIISSLIAIPSSGWFWYVTSLYFNSQYDWKERANYLFYMHSILVTEALWFFFKLLLIVVLLTLILTAVCVENYFSCRRQAALKNWVKDRIMARESLNMSYSRIPADEFWIICMESYSPKDKVTRLPWTQKHYYHTKWIGEWITVNPRCPLCNTDIDASMSVHSESL
jgi:hypothetical protein